jgi:hypothetical protein
MCSISAFLAAVRISQCPVYQNDFSYLLDELCPQLELLRHVQLPLHPQLFWLHRLKVQVLALQQAEALQQVPFGVGWQCVPSHRFVYLYYRILEWAQRKQEPPTGVRLKDR